MGLVWGWILPDFLDEPPPVGCKDVAMVVSKMRSDGMGGNAVFANSTHEKSVFFNDTNQIVLIVELLKCKIKGETEIQYELDNLLESLLVGRAGHLLVYCNETRWFAQPSLSLLDGGWKQWGGG